MCLNAWSEVNTAIWEGLGGVSLLEVDPEVIKAHAFPS